MAKLQIITTFANKPYAASEALWHEVAHYAAKTGHTVEISLNKQAAVTQRGVSLRASGCQLKARRSGYSNRFGYLLQKVWERKLGKCSLRFHLSTDVDICILNVGTLIEVAIEPYASYLLALNKPFSLVVHNNPEIRQYTPRLTDKLRLIVSKALRVYFVSDRLRQTTEEQILQRITRAEIVRNPVNIEKGVLEPWPDEGSLKLAIVGRWDAWVKGQVRAFHALSNPKWKTRNWSLSLFGSGPDTELLKRAVEFYGIQERVNFVGFVDNVRRDIWRSHHVLLMPSMLEGMPLTLVEAMLCGRPAVISDVGGGRELLREGSNGFLAGSPFADQVEDALERMWQAKDYLQKLGQQAYEDASSYVPAHAGREFFDQLMCSLKQENRAM